VSLRRSNYTAKKFSSEINEILCVKITIPGAGKKCNKLMFSGRKKSISEKATIIHIFSFTGGNSDCTTEVKKKKNFTDYSGTAVITTWCGKRSCL
jgi:hypothetical protein